MTSLVRIKYEHLLVESDRAEVHSHGYLWLLDAARYSEVGDPLRWYKSIATGHRHPWFDSEVEGATDE